MRTILLTIVIGVLLLMAGAQVYLPPFMEARLGEGLQAATGIPSLNVELQSFPAVRLLTGAVGHMIVFADDVMVDGLRIESLHLEAADVRIGVGEVLRGRSPSVRAGGEAAVRLTVTSESLTEYANAMPDLPPGMRVDINERGVELAGSVTLLGSAIDATVVGRFQPDGHTGVMFVPDNVAVEGQALPAFLVAVLRELFSVHVDLADGPLPIAVDEVIHMPGRLVVVGRPLLDGFGVVSAEPHRTRPPDTIDVASDERRRTPTPAALGVESGQPLRG